MATLPTTSAEHLQAAGESIRQAMHVDPPTTSTDVYDTLGALCDITAKLEQHLERIGRALNAAANDPELRYSPVTEAIAQTSEQVALHARAAAFRVEMVAGEKLRALVRELNIAWSDTSTLVFTLQTTIQQAATRVTQERAAPIQEALSRAAQDMAAAERRRSDKPAAGRMPRADVPPAEQLRHNVQPADDDDTTDVDTTDDDAGTTAEENEHRPDGRE